VLPGVSVAGRSGEIQTTGDDGIDPAFDDFPLRGKSTEILRHPNNMLPVNREFSPPPI
jgi:hypothetical protein